MLRSVSSVESQPIVIVEPWVILEVDVKLDPLPADLPPPPWRFVVGYDPSAFQSRVSTQILEQDFIGRRVRTKSGRVYELRGEPAIDLDAWHVWLERGGSLPIRDVSGEFWPGYVADSAKAVDTRAELLVEALNRAGGNARVIG